MNKTLIKLTEDLISIPSLHNDLLQAHRILNDVIKKYLPEETFEWTVTDEFPSILYSNHPDTKKFKILLEAHLDVVPAPAEQFQPYEKDGKIYGRGVYDTKAAAAAMLLAFKDISKEVQYPVGLLFTTDGSSHEQTTIQQQIGKGLRAEFVINNEGSNFHIIHKTKGHLLLYLKTSNPGYQSIRYLNDAVKALLDYYQTPEKETEKTTLTILNLETTPEIHGIAKVDVRYAQEDKEMILKKIRSLIPTGITIETGFHFVPVKTNPESIYIKHLQEAAQEITHKKIPLQKTYGGVSEASMFWENGIEVIEFGPKGYGLAHINIKENVEWVDTQNLEEYYEILKKFLLSFN